MRSLKNKTIIITGASSGVGKALAYQLASESCHLVLAARRDDLLADIAADIHTHYPKTRVLYHKTDVSDEQSVHQLFDATKKMFGHIDIVVNNAGQGLQATLQTTSKTAWDRVINTNLTGVFLCSRAAVTHFLDHAIHGHIITVCSLAGLYGAPNYGAYCASKHGVAGFMRSLWLETRRHGIKTTTLYPARIDSDFFNHYPVKPRLRDCIASDDMAAYMITIMKQATLKRVTQRMVLFYKRLATWLRGSIHGDPT